jgi:plasmid maintenance system killer protein
MSGKRRTVQTSASDGNWRVTFTFVGKDANQVDYEDYH